MLRECLFVRCFCGVAQRVGFSRRCSQDCKSKPTPVMVWLLLRAATGPPCKTALCWSVGLEPPCARITTITSSMNTPAESPAHCTGTHFVLPSVVVLFHHWCILPCHRTPHPLHEHSAPSQHSVPAVSSFCLAGDHATHASPEQRAAAFALRHSAVCCLCRSRPGTAHNDKLNSLDALDNLICTQYVACGACRTECCIEWGALIRFASGLVPPRLADALVFRAVTRDVVALLSPLLCMHRLQHLCYAQWLCVAPNCSCHAWCSAFEGLVCCCITF